MRKKCNDSFLRPDRISILVDAIYGPSTEELNTLEARKIEEKVTLVFLPFIVKIHVELYNFSVAICLMVFFDYKTIPCCYSK